MLKAFCGVVRQKEKNREPMTAHDKGTGEAHSDEVWAAALWRETGKNSRAESLKKLKSEQELECDAEKSK